jgi:hypothetical protein
MTLLITSMPCAATDMKTAIPILIVVAIIELTLIVLAIVDLDRRPAVTFDRKWLWVLVIVLFGVIGPVVYFAIGRREAAAAEEAAGERSAPAADRATAAADVLYGARDESANASSDEVRKG